MFGAYPDAKSGVDYKYIDKDALWRDTGFECEIDFKESIMKTANWLKAEIIPEKIGGGVKHSHILYNIPCRKAVAA